MQAKEPVCNATGQELPLLMVDIDGVISLFGGWTHVGSEQGDQDHGGSIDGSWHSIDGTLHFLSSTAAAHLLDLSSAFELVWASGWEERANEHLPHLLGMPPQLPFLRFTRAVGRSNAHWKLDAIDSYACGRPLAWVDDALNDACHQWAQARAAPTLLVQTDPKRGLTVGEAERLAEWAVAL
ncbi:MAG: HAD domain-containing protein [Solirubrobacteraceae bacterium]|jgi:hypothetical protein